MHSDPTEKDTTEEENREHDITVVDESADTIVMSETDMTDNVGDVSVEINVEELVAKVESEQAEDAARKKEVRRRLEDLAESRDFEDTYAIEFDD